MATQKAGKKEEIVAGLPVVIASDLRQNCFRQSALSLSKTGIWMRGSEQPQILKTVHLFQN